MADKKITELTNITGANLADADEFVVVDSSASETKAITRSELGLGINKLGYNGTQKIITTSTGVDVTGTVTADGLTVDGAASAQIVLNEGDTTDLNTRIINNTGKLSTQTWTDAGSLVGTRMLIDHATGDISFYEDTGTTPKFFWDASAEALGIGTSSPTSKLDVWGSSLGNIATFRYTGGTNSPRLELASVSDTVMFIDTSAGTTAPDLAFGTGGTERLRITSTGNVGIGTSSPTAGYRLEVNGGIGAIFNGATESTLRLRANTGSGSYLNLSEAGVAFMWSVGTTGGSSRELQFRSGASSLSDGTERMRIDASGNVGIGTSSPIATLTVLGANNASGGIALTSSTSNATLKVARFKMQHYTNAEEPVTLILGLANSGANTIQIGGGSGAENAATDIQFFTAANTTTTTGTERMRIDSSGRVGINNTAPDGDLTVGNTSVSGDVSIRIKGDATSRGFLMFGDAGGAQLGDIMYDHSDNHMRFRVNNSERMRIDSSGNVGIGSTNPQDTLDLGNGTQGKGITWAGNSGNARFNSIFSSYSGAGLVLSSMFHGSTSADSYVTSYTGTTRASGIRLNWTNDNGIQFFTDTAAAKTAGNAFVPSERMRLDSSGKLFVGTTVVGGAGGFTVSPFGSNGAAQVSFNRADTTLNSFPLVFSNNGVASGTISYNNTSTSYNTSSDYRLKEDVQPMVGASDRVLSLNPVNFAWKADGSRTDGFIAHEVQEVAPYAVTGEKDGEDMQAMDHSKLVPLLTAALQEALGRITALEAEVASLKA